MFLCNAIENRSKEHDQTLIVVLPDWEGRLSDVGTLLSATYAQFGLHGYYLRVYEYVLEELSDDHFQVLIAHELAHVYCLAEKEPFHMVPLDAEPDELRKAEKETERIAKDVTRKWGFDQDGLTKWLAEHALELN
jgi:hypothetical protein